MGHQKSLRLYLSVPTRSMYCNMHNSKWSVMTMSGKNCRKKIDIPVEVFSIVLNDFMHLLCRHEEGSIKTHHRVGKHCLRKKKIYIKTTQDKYDWQIEP